MKQKYTRFFVRLFIMTLLVALAAWALSAFLPEGTVSRAFPLILLLFFTTTAIIHYVLLKITVLNPRRFTSYFMLATFVKLVVYFIAVLVYLFNNRQDALPFIATFMIIYIIYTVFEVALILQQTKND
jgi:hypothetical protein